MTGDTNDILGLMGEVNEAAAPALPTLNLNLSLSDEDLEQPETVQYVPIPQHTTTNFRVYQVEVPPATNRVTGQAELKWKVTFKTEEDTWGPGKLVTDFFLFRQSMSWKWGPFLKAVGLVKGQGNIDPSIFNDPQAIEDVVVSARVLGYSWKQRPGIDPQWPRSYGNKKVAVPTDGTRYYEDLGDYKPEGLKSAEGEDKDEAKELNAMFGTDEYL